MIGDIESVQGMLDYIFSSNQLKELFSWIFTQPQAKMYDLIC